LRIAAVAPLEPNAIRYTSAGDTIRLVGSRHLGHVVVGLFDTGVGLTDHQVIAINAGEQSPPSTTKVATDPAAEPEMGTDQGDSLAGTGLGLSIVRTLAHSRGGTLHASQGVGGGTAMILTFPLGPPTGGGAFAVPESDAVPAEPALPAESFAGRMLGVPGVAEG
jgi:signal transduction histidine kinase